jgi:hypothetical protein
LNMIEKMLIKHIGPLGIRSFRVSTWALFLKNLKTEAWYQRPITHQGGRISIFYDERRWEDRVSHGFFLATFDVSKTFFRTAIKKELITMLLRWSWRESPKHDKGGIRKDITSFPIFLSCFRRKYLIREYLLADLNVIVMYDIYRPIYHEEGGTLAKMRL